METEKHKPARYTVEREFLGKFDTKELIRRIIKNQTENQTIKEEAST